MMYIDNHYFFIHIIITEWKFIITEPHTWRYSNNIHTELLNWLWLSIIMYSIVFIHYWGMNLILNRYNYKTTNIVNLWKLQIRVTPFDRCTRFTSVSQRPVRTIPCQSPRSTNPEIFTSQSPDPTRYNQFNSIQFN